MLSVPSSVQTVHYTRLAEIIDDLFCSQSCITITVLLIW